MGLNGNFGRNPGVTLGNEGELEKTLRRDLGRRITDVVGALNGLLQAKKPDPGGTK
jgi:hypothetical protein